MRRTVPLSRARTHTRPRSAAIKFVPRIGTSFHLSFSPLLLYRPRAASSDEPEMGENLVKREFAVAKVHTVQFTVYQVFRPKMKKSMFLSRFVTQLSDWPKHGAGGAKICTVLRCTFLFTTKRCIARRRRGVLQSPRSTYRASRAVYPLFFGRKGSCRDEDAVGTELLFISLEMAARFVAVTPIQRMRGCGIVRDDAVCAVYFLLSGKGVPTFCGVLFQPIRWPDTKP